RLSQLSRRTDVVRRHRWAETRIRARPRIPSTAWRNLGTRAAVETPGGARQDLRSCGERRRRSSVVFALEEFCQLFLKFYCSAECLRYNHDAALLTSR